MTEPEIKPKPCPICGKPAQPEYRPFCSARCADVDLHRWLGEVYRVETPETPERPDRGDEE
ncbi:MAG: DNA gyrase inhibitor YacG [Magnetospirillum sp.]|nr:DNA gyrase inhibitor YacG [Magnetospirillum sp.]